MADPLPPEYIDGCTIGPQKFGSVDHSDICNEHDFWWWEKRTLLQKVYSDGVWAIKMIRRHSTNGLWIIPATTYAVVGFIVLNTGGWYWWIKKKYDKRD